MDQSYQLSRNSGVIVAPPRDTDFVAGAASGLRVDIRVPDGDWLRFLPTNEQQSGVYFDSMACVTFSALDVIEAQVNMLAATGALPKATSDRLRALGFFDASGRFNASDRFIAKLSGTTKNGNSVAAVWDAIKKYGLVPESDWAFPSSQRSPVFDWNAFYADIPQALVDKGREFLSMFSVNYEWLVAGGRGTVAQYSEWLKASPVQILTPVCPGWNSQDPVAACQLEVQHATMVYAVRANGFGIQDQYRPFEKELAADYPVPYAVRGYVEIAGPATDQAFGRRFAGKMVLDVGDAGSLWYVTPDGRRAKVGRTPEEVAAFLQAVNDRRVPVVGMTDADVRKIPLA